MDTFNHTDMEEEEYNDLLKKQPPTLLQFLGGCLSLIIGLTALGLVISALF